MFFVFNEIHGAVARVESLTGRMENRTFVQIGPSHNNRRAPTLYASDDLDDFIRKMAVRDKPHVCRTARYLADNGLIGWFEAGTNEPLGE